MKEKYNINCVNKYSGVLTGVGMETNLKWDTFHQGDDEVMKSLFDIEKNPIAVSWYGDGQYHSLDVHGWGDRDANYDVLRCFVLKDENKKPEGFVNIGNSHLEDKRTEETKKVIEFGLFFTDKTLANKELISEALNDVLIKYTKEAKANNLLDEYSKIFGTIKVDHPYGKECLLNAGLNEVTKDTAEKEFGHEIVGNRFTYDHAGHILEKVDIIGYNGHTYELKDCFTCDIE